MLPQKILLDELQTRNYKKLNSAKAISQQTMANSDSESPGPSTAERPPVSFLGIAQYQNDPGGKAAESAYTPTTITTGSDPTVKKSLRGLIQSTSQRFGGRPAATPTRENMSAGSSQVMRQRLKNAIQLTKRNERARMYHPQRRPNTNPASGVKLITFSPDQNGDVLPLGASDGTGVLSNDRETEKMNLCSGAVKMVRFILKGVRWILWMICLLLVAYWNAVQPVFDWNSPLRQRYNRSATTWADVPVFMLTLLGMIVALALFLEIQPRVGSVFALVQSWVTEEDRDWF